MSVYKVLTEKEYKELQEALIETQMLPLTYKNIIALESMPFKFETQWDRVTNIGEQNIYWTPAQNASDDGADVNFIPETAYTYALAKTIRIDKARLLASRTAGESLDATIIRQIVRRLEKEVEAFVFKGPITKAGVRLTTAGLFNLAGNTSTYTTVKFAAASGPYETVKNMKGLLLADGFGTGRLDLVCDTTLYPHLWSLPAVDANFSEGDRIRAQLLNGGNIYVSDQLLAPTQNDGSMLLVENSPLNYVLKTPQGLGLDDEFLYYPPSRAYLGRVEGFYQMRVFQPNSICKHTSVDLA